MARVYLSDDATAALEVLPSPIRRELERRLDLLRRFPELYPVVQTGRFRGRRRFVVSQQIHVVYRVFGEAHDCYVVAIQPARAQPE